MASQEIGRPFLDQQLKYDLTTSSSVLTIELTSLFQAVQFQASRYIGKITRCSVHANPKYDWPVLRERFPGMYEKGMPSDIGPNEWFQVKLVISAESVSVYLNRGKVPVLKTKLLGETQGKMSGYWLGNGSGGEWKNLDIKRWK